MQQRTFPLRPWFFALNLPAVGDQAGERAIESLASRAEWVAYRMIFPVSW